MKSRSVMTAICVLAAASIAHAAPFAYVANSGTKNVSIIDTATDTVTATVALPDTLPTVHPYAFGVAVGSSGQKVYVGLQDTNEIAVIDAATKAVIKRIGLGTDIPGGLAVNDAETRLYVTSNMSNTLIVIDISGTGASEVGRVAVDGSAISNPNGVVINAAGTKAYVSSTTTGNVAEISLDETNNVYTRSSVISLGGTQPMGLALSSDGNTLYASSLSGDVRAVKLADSTVYNLKDGVGDPAQIGTGNLALVVKADGSKVYAPSNSVDKLNAIDSSAAPDIRVGSNYAVAAGPYGISATPDGSKLYITMNTSTAGETVKVFDTASNTVTATINLPAGAKPTSFGSFVGPLLQYTIDASATPACTISPSGIVPVNAKGRLFTIANPTGACVVTVDGVSQGVLSAYNFTGLTAGHTISAAPDTTCVSGIYRILEVTWTPNSSDRWLQSTPAGINLNSQSAKYCDGTVVTLNVNDVANFYASNWGGACAGVNVGQGCTITMDANKSVSAVINQGTVPGGPIKNVTKGTYYLTLAEATTAASTGDELRVASSYILGGTTSGAVAANVILSSGWNDSHNVQTPSTMGPLTINPVGVVIGQYPLVI